MGLIVSEVYDALIEAGTSPEKATAAAAAVPLAENVATRDDIARIDGNIAEIHANIAGIHTEHRGDSHGTSRGFTRTSRGFARTWRRKTT